MVGIETAAGVLILFGGLRRMHRSGGRSFRCGSRMLRLSQFVDDGLHERLRLVWFFHGASPSSWDFRGCSRASKGGAGASP